MLRNHLMAQMAAFPNHIVGALVNGVLVPVDGVWENADPPGIALILDDDFLRKAIKAEMPALPIEQAPVEGPMPLPQREAADAAPEVSEP